MRTFPALLAVTVLAAVGLVGCTSSEGASCARPSPAPGTFDLIEVSGSAGNAPRVSVRTPFHASATTADDLQRGDGPAITAPDQLVNLDLSLISGETGGSVVATAYDGNPARALPLSQYTQAFPGLEGALECATEGSRVVVALAAADIDPMAAMQFGLREGESAIAVVDLHKVYLAKADGADQFNQSHGLPTVVRAPDGRPGVIVPDAVAPGEPVVQVLKRGDGPAIDDEATARVHVTIVGWDDRRVVNSTWGQAPQPLTLGDLPPVLADALEGQTVGSQVLVVTPGDEAAAQGGEGQARVYVFDILGIDGA